ncbi:MAG: DUF3368 domain-containing protein [Candidatus Freyarchaeota archaeon]
MNPLIFNATPLIYLAKAGLIEHVGKLPEKKYLPKSVYDEVVTKGKERGLSDAFRVDKLVEEGVIEIKSPSDKKFTKRLLRNQKIHLADAEVMTLARELDEIALMDDEESRAMANLEKISNHGTVYLMFRFLWKGLITKKEFVNSLNRMIREGWRCSVELYGEIIKALNGF